MYEVGEGDKLKSMVISRRVVQDEINKHTKNMWLGADEILPRVMKECKVVLSDTLPNIIKVRSIR